MVWEMMFDYDIDSFVVILDEIDMLKDENLIRSLPRAEESGKTDGYVSLIELATSSITENNSTHGLIPASEIKRSYSIRTMRIAYEIFCTAEKKPSSTELSRRASFRR